MGLFAEIIEIRGLLSSILQYMDFASYRKWVLIQFSSFRSSKIEIVGFEKISVWAKCGAHVSDKYIRSS